MVGGEADAGLEDIDVGAVNHVGGAKAVLGDPQFDSVFYVARTAELRASLEGKGGEVGVEGRLSRCQDWGRGHTENHPSHRADRV